MGKQTPLQTVKLAANAYSGNFSVIWRNRMTWLGRHGDTPQYNLRMDTFFRDTDIPDFSKCRDIDGYQTAVYKAAASYTSWCSLRDPTLTADDLRSLADFFVGVMGELFFLLLLSEVGSIVVDGKMYRFRDVAPLMDSHDFGVDGTCWYSVDNKERACAIQVKFWNQFIMDRLNLQLTMKVAQGVFAQAQLEGFIDPSEDHDVIICWLGSDRNVSSFLKENRKLYRKLLFIDMSAIQQTVNDKCPWFWVLISERLSAIAGK